MTPEAMPLSSGQGKCDLSDVQAEELCWDETMLAGPQGGESLLLQVL